MKRVIIFCLLVLLTFGCSNKDKRESNETKISEKDYLVKIDDMPEFVLVNDDEVLPNIILFDEAIESEIVGKYYFNSLDEKKAENAYTIQFYDYISSVNFEIIHNYGNNYFLTYDDPKNVLFSKNLNIEFKYPTEYKNIWYPDFISKYDGTPFYRFMAEKGGGGTYIFFYYNDDRIIIDYQKKYYSLYEDEDGDLAISSVEWFELNIVFEKVK